MVSYPHDGSTAQRVLDALEPFKLKQETSHQYRCNSPFRDDSDSMGFALTIDDGEHGAYYDHARDEKGSLYDLAQRLGIPSGTERISVESTKRRYANAEDYARAHGITVAELYSAQITETTLEGHLALAIWTATGTRYRFLDGKNPPYTSPRGYKRCWYGLPLAIARATSARQSLVLCNGEISTVVGQHYGLAATCITSGEKPAIPPNLLIELKQSYTGPLIVALDCDKAGRDAAHGIIAQLRGEGFQVTAVDLGLSDGGDLADFCRLYEQNSYTHLQELSPLEDAVQETASPRRDADLSDAADCWQKMNPDIAWDDANQTWRRWNGLFWQDNTKPTELDRLTEDALRSVGLRVTSANRLDTVLRLVQSRCSRDFTAKPGLINFRNGTFGVLKKSLQSHSKVDNLITCLPFDYAPGRFDQIARWLINSIPDAWGRCAYMVHIGLALCGDVGQHKALVLWGPPRSGKTTALALAQKATGQPMMSFAHQVLFEGTSHGGDSRAQWRHRPVVCLDEWPEDALRDCTSEEFMKGMIAHSGVTVREMYYSEDTDNRWCAKLMFATNNMPQFKDPSGALMRRLMFISFPTSLPDASLDPDLPLKFEPELPGFVAACIDLAQHALDLNVYPESDAMRELRDRIECNSDGLKLWIRDECEFDPEGWTPSAELYSAYRSYSGENGLATMSHENMSKALLNRYGQLKSLPKNIQGKTKRGMLGIRLHGDKETRASAEPVISSEQEGDRWLPIVQNMCNW